MMNWVEGWVLELDGGADQKIEGNNASADDAIMLDKDDYVSETNATNILLVNILTFLAKNPLCLGISICCFRGKQARWERTFLCLHQGKLVNTACYKCQEQLLFSIPYTLV